MLKIRRPLGRLIFNMGIAIPGKTVFLIETAPRYDHKYTLEKLTHCGQVTSYDDKNLGQFWLRCRHQAITWTNIKFSLVRFCGTRVRTISQPMSKIIFFIMSLKFIFLKSSPHSHGTMVQLCHVSAWQPVRVYGYNLIIASASEVLKYLQNWISNNHFVLLLSNRFRAGAGATVSQEICTRFLLCCALLWLYIDWISHIHRAYFTGTVAI